MAGIRAIVTIGLAVIFLLLAGPPMFAHPPTAYTGILLRKTSALVHSNIVDVDQNSPAFRAGVRSGDIISCLSRRDRALLFLKSEFGYAPGYAPGTPISFCVHRAGVSRTIRFVATTQPPSPSVYGNDAIAALRLAEYAVFLLSGIALVLGRPGAMTWIFFAFCIASLPNLDVDLNMTVLPAPLYFATQAVTSVAGSSSLGWLLLFAILVPNDRVPPGWRTYAYYAAWLGLTLSVAAWASARLQTNVTVSLALFSWMGNILTAATIAVVLARLASMQRSERARFGWAAFAIIWGVVTNNLRSVAVLPGSAGTVAAMLTVIMPVALMYAILKRHVIDVRFVISRTVVYAAITTIVVGLIGAVDWATSAYLHEARAAMAIEALVTIGLGFVLHRTYRWLEYTVDFFLFRRKYEAESYLRRLARTLNFAEREDAVDRALVHDPYEKFDLTAAALFRANGTGYVTAYAQGWNDLEIPAFGRDHDVVRFLLAERTRLFIGDLREYVAAPFRELGAAPAVAIPVFQGNRLTAFALYGVHRSGTKLDPDEVETLEHVCEAAAQAYTGIELARYQGAAPAALAMEAL